MTRETTPAEKTAIQAWYDQNDPDHDRFEYSDNFRVATVGNAEEEAAYEEAERNGCCGSVNIELQTEDGAAFLYGFNYGH